jgi:hypothetical protein
MQHQKLTCYLDVVYVWSVRGLHSAKTVSLACESSYVYCPLCIFTVMFNSLLYMFDNTRAVPIGFVLVVHKED